MKDTKILIAEDDKDIMELMIKKISAEGYNLVTASDGEEAWEKIKSENPDVILLDLLMPKMDGYAVLKKLRENPPSGKWQPVIIVSSLSELEDMKKGFDLEADHYITKPCEMEDVLRGVQTMVNLIPQRKSKFEMKKDKNK